jgi:hypothetical protein
MHLQSAIIKPCSSALQGQCSSAGMISVMDVTFDILSQCTNFSSYSEPLLLQFTKLMDDLKYAKDSLITKL